MSITIIFYHVGNSIAAQYIIEQNDQSWSLTKVAEEKDLGILRSNDLKVSTKLSRKLWLIKRHFFKLDKSTFLILYKCYVHPHLEYSIQAWSPFLQKDGVSSEANNKNEGFKRLKKLGLTTFEKSQIRGDVYRSRKSDKE